MFARATPTEASLPGQTEKDSTDSPKSDMVHGSLQMGKCHH